MGGVAYNDRHVLQRKAFPVGNMSAPAVIGKQTVLPLFAQLGG